jgi:hypothetical protein
MTPVSDFRVKFVFIKVFTRRLLSWSNDLTCFCCVNKIVASATMRRRIFGKTVMRVPKKETGPKMPAGIVAGLVFVLLSG